MEMHKMRLVDPYLRRVICALFAIAPLQLQAGPPDFLPGDAFFSGRISTRINPDVPVDGTLLLHYELPPASGGFMKFSYGTLRLKLTGITPENWKVWKQGIEEIRQTDNETLLVLPDKTRNPPEEIIEQNPLYVFVYPKSFKVTEFRPFMRYNENWSDECTALGVPLKEQSLPSFYRDSGHREWRDAKLVPRLPVVFGSREGEKADRRPNASFGGGSLRERPTTYPDNRDAASFPYEKATVILAAETTLRDLMNRDDSNLMPEKGTQIIVIHDTQWESYFSTGKKWSRSEDLDAE